MPDLAVLCWKKTEMVGWWMVSSLHISPLRLRRKYTINFARTTYIVRLTDSSSVASHWYNITITDKRLHIWNHRVLLALCLVEKLEVEFLPVNCTAIAIVMCNSERMMQRINSPAAQWEIQTCVCINTCLLHKYQAFVSQSLSVYYTFCFSSLKLRI